MMSKQHNSNKTPLPLCTHQLPPAHWCWLQPSKNCARIPDCSVPVLHNHQRWNNPPTSMRLSMHHRWCSRVRIAKNEEKQVKNVFILIFYCDRYQFILGPVHGYHGHKSMSLPYIPLLQKTQSITVQKGNEKMVRTNVILSFSPQIHSTPIIEAMAAWPTLIGCYCPHTILPTLLPPSSYRKVTQCQNTRPKGEVLMHLMFLA